MAIPEMKELMQLPEGYSVRPTTLDDAEASVKLWEIISIHKGTPEIIDVEEERAGWTEPNFNLSDSSIVIEDNAGNVVGIASLHDNSEIPVRNWLNWNVHPQHEGKGLETYLIQWLENKAQRVIDRCPPNTQITLNTSSYASYEPRKKILENAGYTHQRNFHRMKTTLTTEPPKAQIAKGFSIRPMRYPEEFEAGVIARVTCFRDHWGFVEQPIEEDLRDWQHALDTDKLFDPSLFFFAIDDSTGAIAGICWGRMEEHSDPENAYISQVGVLPQYRKNGLALALLQHSFGEFWRRGRKDITLYVDASSLTGATQLYEKAGMQADRIWASYGKIIREGVNLATTNVES